MKYRHENFGGILASDEPPFLAFVDRDYMRELGLGESELWQRPDEGMGALSAPTEVHFAVTNRCPSGCRHCYMGAGDADAGEMDTAAFKSAIDQLAAMRVFHVAMGGGEALVRPDLFELAAYARDSGIVPNLTTSGAIMTPELAGRMRVFGQVNVSIDGVGELSGCLRGRDTFASADKAVDMLVAAGVPTGINCVVGRRNFEGIEDLFAYARQKGVNEIEFLRLKPAGRGGRSYLDEKTTRSQNVGLIPKLAGLSDRFAVRAKIDCSFVPMLCWHKPPFSLLEAMATFGCEAGNVLAGVRSNGVVSGCSFLPCSGMSVMDLKGEWDVNPYLRDIRSLAKHVSKPCSVCEYLDICKGGCHAVSLFVKGDINAPDPDCPFVVEHAGSGEEDR